MPRRGTMQEDDGLKLSSQLCFAVHATALAFSAAYKPILDPLGLTYPQYLVLLVLWEQDGLTVKQIGEKLHLDSGTLTPMLKRLQAAGFVTRRRDEQDERLVRVELTERGRAIRSAVSAGRRSLVCALGKSEEEVQALREIVNELNLLLRTEKAEPTSEGNVAPPRHKPATTAA